MDATIPTKEGIVGSKPTWPTTATWKGKPLESLSKQELMPIISLQAAIIESMDIEYFLSQNFN